ncbi:MAG: cytochrome c, partial [Deltaproteobacteria bacterium]|nr:cytochrome c [Deltaproteobacteria bacterium]
MACPPRAVEVDDPYHHRAMRYFAMPFRCVLAHGFAALGGADALRGQGLLLRALDGYTRPASGGDLLAGGAHLAFGEVALMSGSGALPRFTPIGRRQVDAGPFYLVWSGAGQNDPAQLPWPYQLETIEVASFPKTFPRTVPKGLEASHPGWTGYALFQRSCASCHAINGQGGKIGPDLNVPRSIVEYRPIEEIKSYVRNPEATRYTSMPAHPDLSDADLDALVAYLEAMSHRKQDPRAEA